uniref:Zinc transporter ZIP9 n=1 Tax=Rousettus aegyptiacus TaxID=9407 RepID=A0A7J8ISC3_ROUAE|nr:solute carrier family 39 member 9 [Rousettus aegyptiacus]
MNMSIAMTTHSCMHTSVFPSSWALFSCCWWIRLEAPICILLMIQRQQGLAIPKSLPRWVWSSMLQAPAAFGLVSFLMHAGLERNRIRKHLLVFALAAPVMSLVTFLGLSKSSKEALSEVNATGVAMLFSAGTFLYVATVHVLPEVGGMGHSHRPDPNGGRGLSRLEVAALVLGCLIPLILSVEHQH